MQIESVAVIGCGLMGHGIVQVAATAGLPVRVHEPDGAALDRGLTRIDQSLLKLSNKLVEKGKKTAEQASIDVEAARARIKPATTMADLADVDLVIEAVVEDLDVKRSLFSELGAACKPEAILATNTSSFPVAEMAEASGRPGFVLGLHFFNPVQLMQLVEIARTDDTSEVAFEAARDFVKRIGKLAVPCKDTPGFVVNRLLVPFMVQAMLMIDRGEATPQAIDIAMQFGAGHPMGPITLADYVGLDTTLAIVKGWTERYPDEPAFALPQCLRAKVVAGDFGRKTGQGFYAWDGDKRAE